MKLKVNLQKFKKRKSTEGEKRERERERERERDQGLESTGMIPRAVARAIPDLMSQFSGVLPAPLLLASQKLTV